MLIFDRLVARINLFVTFRRVQRQLAFAAAIHTRDGQTTACKMGHEGVFDRSAFDHF